MSKRSGLGSGSALCFLDAEPLFLSCFSVMFSGPHRPIDPVSSVYLIQCLSASVDCCDLMRFCMSNVVAYGQTFLDLVLHIAAYIKRYMTVSYEPASMTHRRFAESVVKLALGKRLRGGDDKSEWRRKLDERIQTFLNIFNGDWKVWSPGGLKHHCSIRCSCGGMKGPELGSYAASLFTELVLCSRPPIPALSRWLKCSETAKWYVLLGLPKVY